MDLRATRLGIGTPHPVDMVVDRPRGDGEYLTMCFQTPFFVLTKDGETIGAPGDCVIHSPGFPHYHGTAPGQSEGFRNDWIHVGGADVGAVLERYGLPVNTIIPLYDGLLVRSYINQVRRERLERGYLWRESIAQQINLMYLNIARAYHDGINSSTESSIYRKRLVEIRAALHNDIRRNWRVDELANMAHISGNRFAVLYRKIFGLSPIEDLIRARISEAKHILLATNSSIEDVALECGFSNIYYFSKVFKERTGVPPSRYRRTGRG